MELLQTEIRAEGQTVKVEFLGEGGEKVAVTMADPGLDTVQEKSALIDRAKQMMVQVVAFEAAETEYDQKPAGISTQPL